MAAFHYVVRVNLIRNKANDDKEIDFVTVEETFKNENPIVARNEAFSFYQNFIEVLLQSKGKEYTSDKEAREELRSFIDPGTKTKLHFGGKEIEFSDAFGNGIGIFLIVDEPKPDTMHDDKAGEEIFIHGVGEISRLGEDTDPIIFELQREFEYYTYYNYETNNKTVEVVYCSRDEWEEGYLGNGQWLESYGEPNTYKILETPFDWTGLDVPYWWGEPDNEEDEDEEIPQSLEEIIEQGESNQVEFKPSLLYNFKTQKGAIGVKAIIAKAICAFLNSNGGILLIGVNDNGESQGLEYDFSLAEGKKEKDFFRLEFDKTLQHFFPLFIRNYIADGFYKIDEKIIYYVIVRPSKRPVFMRGQNGKEFYVRQSASSRQENDIEEIVNYCIHKWGIEN